MIRGKTAAKYGIGAIILLLALIMSCYSINIFIAKQLKAGLASLGTLPSTTVHVNHFMPGVKITNIVIIVPTSTTGNVQITIPNIIVTYNLTSLLHGKINTIDIPTMNVSLQGAIQANVFAINPETIDKKLVISQFIKKFPYLAINIENIRIEQGNIKNLTLTSVAQASLQLQRTADAENTFKILFLMNGKKLALTINEVLIKTKNLAAELKGNLILTDAINIIGDLSIKTTQLSLPDTKIVIDAGSIHAGLNSNNDKFQLHGNYDAAGFYLDNVAFIQDPLSFSGNFLADNNSLQASLNGHDKLQYFTGTGKLNGYQLQLKLESQHLISHVLNLQRILPWLTQPIILSQGQLQLDGTIGLSAKTPTSLRITGKSLSGKIQASLFTDLDTALTITRFYPLLSEPAQVASLKRFNPGLPFDNMTLMYQLTADKQQNPQIEIIKMQGKFAGGNIAANNFILTPNDKIHRVPVTAKNISVNELLRFSKVNGLSGTGTLNGNMMLQWDDNGLQITHGDLLGAGKDNKIVYNPKALPPAMQVKSEQLTLVLSALKNFHYRNFKVHVKNIGDNTEIIANLVGFNPDLYDGLPIELNFTLTGQIYLILDTILIGDKFKRKIIDSTLNGN